MVIVITNPAQTPITPSDIDTSTRFVGKFGSGEVEGTYFSLTRFYQERGEWGPFTQKEIDQFFGHPWNWYSLLEMNIFVRDSDHKFWPTLKFITACYAASPAVRAVPVP